MVYDLLSEKKGVPLNVQESGTQVTNPLGSLCHSDHRSDQFAANRHPCFSGVGSRAHIAQAV